MKFNLILVVSAFLSSMSSLQAQWSGSNVSTVTNSYVGIGTSSPASPLTVNGQHDEIGLFINNATSNTRLIVRNQTGDMNLGIGNAMKFGYVWSGTGKVFIGDDGNPTLMVSGMNNGSVGIGNMLPETKLDIKTTASLDGIRIIHNDQSFINIQATSLYQNAYNSITQAGDAGIIFGSRSGPGALNFGFVIAPHMNGLSGLRVDKDGNVGIATGSTYGYRLAVNGNAVFNKVVVKQYPNWPDYVFKTDYHLRPLSEVEQYIKQNHHLPEMVSAEEVEKNGLDVGDNQATLLKKIEELTLYMIDQSKKQQKLAEEVAELKKENTELKKIISKKK